MEKSYELHLVSHVHWDPMWYLTFEQYRMRLIPLLSRLLDILDNDPEYLFMFDGQVSAIDDYLAIMPQDEERIRRHVKSGHLLIGPWYIQPEEFMISGESHIRNLQLGIKRGQALGGTMNASYLCDMVGHIAQAPQIIRGFGLDSFIGFRGVPDGRTRMTTEFIWEGPDGSQVLFKEMPRGYQNIIPSDEEGFVEKIREMKADLTQWATTGFILIMQGGDHLEALPDIPKLIRTYNEEAGRMELHHTTLPSHLSALKAHWDELPLHKGELRSSWGTPMLTGILSTRIEVKLASEELSRKIERWAEPFSTFGCLTGGKYPTAILDYVWNKQIRNAFHDCIYGAHADTVTPDIMNDYKRSQEALTWVVNDALHEIAVKAAAPDSQGTSVAIFNPCPWERTDAVIPFDVFIEGGEIRRELVAIGKDGSQLPIQVESVHETKRFGGSNGNWTSISEGSYGNTYHCSVRIPILPAMGYTLINVATVNYRIRESRKSYGEELQTLFDSSDLRTIERGMENNKLKITFSDNGSISVVNKETGRMYSGIHVFEDGGDSGDQYNYSPPVQDRIYTGSSGQTTISLVSRGPLRATYRIDTDLMLPKGCVSQRCRDENLAVNHITTFVTLASGSPVLEFKTSVDNESRDHRLRLAFHTGLNCRMAAAGSQFYVVERSTKVDGEFGNHEKAWGNYPHRQFVDISDGTDGMAFLDRGLPEYEADERGSLYITLLRCTGVLSKDSLPERSYTGAGPGLPTPLGQELGQHYFEYALYFHKGTWLDGDVPKVSDQFYASTACSQVDTGKGKGLLPQRLSFFEIKGQDIMLSAIKTIEKDSIVVRVYNCAPEKRQCTMFFWRSLSHAALADLNDNPVEGLAVSDNILSLELDPHKIATVIIGFKNCKGGNFSVN